ncbi:MAG: PD-(D/E)XK nuclease family protein [Planctomycetota bacterium]|nr:MAG: PD-(D/E)XK nuclease family protein [Planctomycetota bacterium]
MPSPAHPESTALRFPGPAEAQSSLIAEIRRRSQDSEPWLRQAPWTILVSTAAQRRDLATALVAGETGAILGLQVQTLAALARDLAEEAGFRRPSAHRWFAVLARRSAQQQPQLASLLANWEESPQLLVDSQESLLRAGYRPDTRPAFDRHIPGPWQAQALAEATETTWNALQKMGLEIPGHSWMQAERALQAGVRPAGRLLAFGFAGAPEPERRFLAALQDRLPVSSWDWELDPPAAGSDWHHFHAPQPDAEAREIAYRIRQSLDQGSKPESIAVVSPALTRMLPWLRHHFEALGLPFAGPADPARQMPAFRRWKLWLDCCRLGPEAWTEDWLEAAALPLEVEADLGEWLRAKGCHSLGSVTAEAASSSPEPDQSLSLTVVAGLEADNQTGSLETAASREPAEAGFLQRRRLPAQWWQACLQAARACLRHWQEWPKSASVSEHLAYLQRGLPEIGVCLKEQAFWAPPLPQEVAECLGSLQGPEIDAAEFRLLLIDSLRTALAQAEAGPRAGIQLLAPEQARGVPWKVCFLAGLQRGQWPPAQRDDPWLPESATRPLADLLPDWPSSDRRRQRDQQLFSELCRSAAELHFSWSRGLPEGGAQVPSPYLDALFLRQALPVAERLPAAEAAALDLPHAGSRQRPRPLRESRRLQRLQVSGTRFALELDPSLPEALARARCQALAAWDGPWPQREDGLPALAGAVGPPLGPDPRLTPTYLTTLEATARCPWQSFLARLLRLPDYGHQGPLPQLDPALFGNVVHQTLEACSSVQETPSPSHWRPILDQVVREQCNRAGIRQPGLHRALALRAEPYLARALARLWPPRGTVSAELEGAWEPFPNGPPVHFRADRVERFEDGQSLWVDFKTGKPPTQAKRPETRLRHWRQAVARGRGWQAPAYAAAQKHPKSEGQFLFLHPDLEEEAASFSLHPGDPLLEEIFLPRLKTVWQSWHTGTLPPRLEDAQGNEPDPCRYCPYPAACLRGDSGARRRLRIWMQAAGDSEAADRNQARAIWFLAEDAS